MRGYLLDTSVLLAFGLIAADVDVRAADWRLTLGHQQISDAYLAGLARHHRLKLATLDQGLSATHPDVATLLT